MGRDVCLNVRRKTGETPVGDFSRMKNLGTEGELPQVGMGVAVKQRRMSLLKHPGVGRLIPLGLCNILHPMLLLQGAIFHEIIIPWSKNDYGGMWAGEVDFCNRGF